MTILDAFIQQFLELANPKLTKTEQDLLANLLTQLFTELDLGNSCLILENLPKNTFGTTTNLINILNKSALIKNIFSAKNSTSNNNHINDFSELKPLSLLRIVTERTKSHLHLLYITRYFHYELSITSALKSLNKPSIFSPQDIQKHLNMLANNNANILNSNTFPNKEQLLALNLIAKRNFSIITGGPGTGKTTTVVALLWLLQTLYNARINHQHSNKNINDIETNTLKSTLNIAVCAPTGKAVSRAQNAILQTAKKLEDELNITLSGLEQINFATLHKLLCSKKNSIYFWHNDRNKLKLDILIIDESSMISLPLFYKLLQALDHDHIKHIIFLGDKNQLSSVEEGYVFTSIIKHYINISSKDLLSDEIVAELLQSNRNSENIHLLGQYVLSGNYKQAIAYLKLHNLLIEPNFKETLLNIVGVKSNPTNSNNHNSQQNFNNIKNNANTLINSNNTNLNNVKSASLLIYVNYLKTTNFNEDVDINELFRKFLTTAILCLTNSGLCGVDNLSLHIENLIKRQLHVSNSIWYNGRPIIILENDYQLDLNNGDIGICIIKNNIPTIVFADGRSFVPEVLPTYKLAYALTIHKSQGSEFNNVVIVIPKSDKINYINNLLTRELIYTAITRARFNVVIYAEEYAIELAIKNLTTRHSGLEYLLKKI